MVIWVGYITLRLGCITLRLTSRHKNSIQALLDSIFLFVGTHVKISKIVNLIQIWLFQFLSKFCIYHWDIHSSKNNYRLKRSS